VRREDLCANLIIDCEWTLQIRFCTRENSKRSRLVHAGNILVMVGSKLVSLFAVGVKDYSGDRGPGIILHNKQSPEHKIYY